MRNIVGYPTKKIECDDCGRVSKVARHIPLRNAWCPECRSKRIRLYKPLRAKPGRCLEKRLAS